MNHSMPGLAVHHQLLEFTQSIELVMPSSHLILCRPPLLLPPILPSIRVFSNESTLCMRWPKYWSYSAIKKNTFEPVLMRWMKLEPIIQSEVSQKEKHQYSMWSEVTQSCPTLSDPMDCSPPGFSIHGIFQAWVLEWVAISFSRGSFQPRDLTRASHIAGRCFTI